MMDERDKIPFNVTSYFHNRCTLYLYLVNKPDKHVIKRSINRMHLAFVFKKNILYYVHVLVTDYLHGLKI